MNKLVGIVALVATACGGGSTHRHVAIANLSYDVPADWQFADTTGRGLMESVWTPDGDNQRKESVTVIRSERSPATAHAGASTIERLLRDSLLGARILTTGPITTLRGLSGVRVETDFVPPGLSTSYHRVHVVLVDGPVLVHVMYTSKTPDVNAEAFNLVLRTIQHEET